MTSVLITGGSGSFGNAFVRHLLKNGLSERICIFSRGEHRQAQMRSDLKNDPRLRFFVGDVRDRDRLRRAMEGVDIVIHAAALKRIEVGELNPIEMARTNVDGAINVIEAASDARVKKVVALSTDKACNPVSTYGASKMMAEKLFLSANNTRGTDGPIFSVVRYGNIANSEGSVIPKWRALIAQGHQVVPTTDPECTRYFMFLDEAVDLVWHTVTTMQGGELAIPELPAFRLGDLATAMDVGMEITGLAPHEKLAEEMIHGKPSDLARRMSIPELKEALARV